MKKLIILISLASLFLFSKNNMMQPILESQIIKKIIETVQTEVTEHKNTLNNKLLFDSQKMETVIKTEVDKILNKSQSFDEIKLQIKEDSTPLGSAGRLYVPSIYFNVALNETENTISNTSLTQNIVDEHDSAAYFKQWKKEVIADHNYQGLGKINNLEIGDYAFIKSGKDQIKTYQLNKKINGKNTIDDLVDNSGNSIKDVNADLIIYTCYTSEKDIIVTFWNKIS